MIGVLIVAWSFGVVALDLFYGTLDWLTVANGFLCGLGIGAMCPSGHEKAIPNEGKTRCDRP